MNADRARAATGLSAGRRALLPAATLPLAYFAGAHIALALAFASLLVEPGLPGPAHYHPRLIAVLHLVTLGWVSGSILGALYIAAPLALGLPFRARRTDAIACLGFWLGTAGMVSGFWIGRYAMVGIASLFVLGALLALSVFLAWLVGLPLLTVGLMTQHHGSIATGSAVLLCATCISAAHGALIIRRARS